MEVNNLVVVSDLHCGCRFGLCPPEPQFLDGGAEYKPSEIQIKLWAWWEEFWNVWVPKVIRGEPFAVCINGDLVDGRHHRSVTQISQNLADQSKIAKNVLMPIVERCAVDSLGNKEFYVIRGTEAHGGTSGEEEEILAHDLGAKPDSAGHYSRYQMLIRLGGRDGTLVHLSHHIGITGSTHYESSALMRELGEHFTDAGRFRKTPPDIIVRSHRHRYSEVRIPTGNGYGICAVTPGWQVKTPFVFKIPGGRTNTPQCGGLLVRHGDEEGYTRSLVFDVESYEEVIAGE
jgi:hypothetical protein